MHHKASWVVVVSLSLLFCCFRFVVKNNSVQTERTRTKCTILFFGLDPVNQEHQSTSVNTPLNER